MKGLNAEKIINRLREAEVLLGQGQTLDAVCRKLSMPRQILYRWLDAKKAITQWTDWYNASRPASVLRVQESAVISGSTTDDRGLKNEEHYTRLGLSTDSE